MSEYRQLADKYLAEMYRLRDEKTRIEREIKNTRQLVEAVVNMMTDEERHHYKQELGALVMKEMGLTESVRKALQGSTGYLSPMNVRDALIENGFDFSGYTSNPLVSVHSVLKRFKPEEVETILLPDGATGYRWKPTRPRRKRG